MIGRLSEIEIIKNLLVSPKAEFLTVFGRRRVGKTYLIKNAVKENITFEFTGTQYASIQNQLFKFWDKLNESFDLENVDAPKNWAEAFSILKKCLAKNKSDKQVIFFDELPWIASAKSNFLEEMAYFWNDWASNNKIVLIVCGSASSWMVKNLLNNKGGLHNRTTQKINVKPFTLAETKLFIDEQNIGWDYYQIIQYYMSVGGIPTYWNEVKKGESALQTIERVFFTKDGSLRNEFNNLYAALFENSQKHVSVIKILAEKWKGLSRQEIIEHSHFNDGGALSKVLLELELSSFITKTNSFDKKQKGLIYRLTDEYSLFYLKFIENNAIIVKNTWQQINTQPKFKVWAGYSFENLCIKHHEAIKFELGIQGVYVEVSSFYSKENGQNDGIQIDMILNRADNVINLCEIKYCLDDFQMTDQYAETLRKRRETFRRISKTKKTLFNTIITTYGVQNSKNSSSVIDNIITMDKLFTLKTFD